MKDIRRVYESMSYKDEITFMSLRGHLLELKGPAEYDTKWGNPWKLDVLPMIPERFEYKVKSEHESLYRQIEAELKSGKYDYVINACDAGREGELIFYSLYRKVGVKLPVKRFWASDTTDETVKNALNNLIDDKEKTLTCLKASAQYRACFDWLLGMNLSRAISLKNKAMISVGRVMTPTMAIIAQREIEIRDFKPSLFWEVEADFKEYKGLWIDEVSGESRLTDKAKAEVLKKLSGKKGQVISIEEKEEKNFAPTLHSLLELQKEANKVYGYTADRTLELAQSLYEQKKLLSYPRTESRHLPKNLAAVIPKHLESIKDIPETSAFVASILSDKKRMNETLNNKKYVDDKKITDHHAIIPTNQRPNLSSLNKDELNIYMLVVKRFLAIFMPPYIVNKSTLITKVEGNSFKTTGKIVKDKGYMVMYKDDEKDKILPALKEGDWVDVKEINVLNKQTTPPSRYDDSTLLQAMQNAGRFVEDEELKTALKESAGLGTSATRAEIIKKIVAKEMVMRKGKYFYATDLGLNIYMALKDQEISSPELTARWEIKLSDIEEQKYDYKLFYDEMLEYARSVTIDIINNMERTIFTNSGEEIGKCPKCGGAVMEKKEYYVCSNYKKTCDLIIGKVHNESKISVTEAKKILSGKETKEMEFKWKSGKSGKAKLKYDPNEQRVVYVFANQTQGAKMGEKSGAVEVLGKCPICGGDVINGKEFYLCKNYKDTCTFTVKKNLKGGVLIPGDMKKLLEGEETREIQFVWDSGKTGIAKLKLKGDKLGFIFS